MHAHFHKAEFPPVLRFNKAKLSVYWVHALSQVLWDPRQEEEENHDKKMKKQWPALACSAGVVVIVLLDWDFLFVTSADQVFFWSTVAYILVYLAIHLSSRWPTILASKQEGGEELPIYNVIVATLQLTACRFYSAAETPYNLVLIGILACRGWYAGMTGRPQSLVLK